MNREHISQAELAGRLGGKPELGETDEGVKYARLNVATSRAKCVCVLVASPSVFEVRCRTPRQMQLANAFARYLELAAPLAFQHRG